MRGIISLAVSFSIMLSCAAVPLKRAAAASDTLQQGNINAIGTLDAVSPRNPGGGLTYLNSREVINYNRENKFKMYSPQLAIDGDRSTPYSSGLYYNNNSPSNDWIQIEFPKTEAIYTVNLTPLPGGSHFPYAFDIQTSTDGSTWTTAVSKSNVTATNQDVVKCVFSTVVSARYVRVLSKTLKGSGTSYYAQFSEIAVMNTSDENVALYSSGARASSANPLNGDLFDYDTFYSDTLDTGTGWVNITNEFAYSDYKSGFSTEPSSTEIENFKKISDAGIKIIYRFMNAPSLSEVTSDPDAAADNYINAIEPRVRALKDYVDVWSLFPEINSKGNSNASSYAAVIRKVGKRIKEMDPTAKIKTATALIDYEWTRALLEAGIADTVDIIGLHIYKDLWPTLSYPEVVGNYMQDGKEITNPSAAYADYAAQINAYKSLIAGYSSNIEVMVTEVSEPAGLLYDRDAQNLVQAKWLTRQYAMDKRLGISATFWFTVDPISAPRIVSTLVSTDGERTPAWYAMQNYNTIFCKETTRSSIEPVITGAVENLMYDVYETDDEYLIPYWYTGSFSESFQSGTIDINLNAFGSNTVTAVDLLTGKTQRIELTNGTAKKLIVQDYVTVLKIEKQKNAREVWHSADGDTVFGHNGHDTNTKMTAVYDSAYTTDGGGSVKIEWTNSNPSITDAQLALRQNEIPLKPGQAVKAVTMDVYVPPGDAAEGTSLYGYARYYTGEYYMNGFYNKCEPRTLKSGWQRVVFDTVNCTNLNFLIWENTTGLGTIYIDNICVEYQAPDGVFDSFENYTDDWSVDSAWTASVNTDKSYVKDGDASLRVDVTAGERYILRSNWLNFDGIRGKKPPIIDGLNAKTFGMWIYNSGARAAISPELTEKQWRELNEGWNYVEWKIMPGQGAYWYWDEEHFSQMVVRCTSPGTVYLDAMNIGYQGSDILDAFGTLEKWLTSNISLNTNPSFVYEGTGSGRVELAANSGEKEIASSNYSKGGLLIPEAEGKSIDRIGMWIFGDGSGAQIKLRGECVSYSHDSEWVTIDFTGWRYVTFSAPSNGYIYSIIIKNTSSQNAVFYIDNMKVEYSGSFSADTPVITNSSGGGMSVGDTIVCSAGLHKWDSGVYDICIAAAVYSGDGRLLGIRLNTQQLAQSDTGDTSISVSITVPEGAAYAKCFVWNGSDRLTPYASAVRY